MPEFKQFKLPDVGEGLTEADILTWHVKPGDPVTVNQTIVEIETAKAVVELPSPYAGVVSELLAPEGATVDVGTPIISVDVDPNGPAPGAVEPTESAGSAESAESAEGEPGEPAEVEPAAAGEPPATAPALRDDLAPEVPRPPEDQPVEPGLIGGPAPGGRTSVLVGYGPRSVVAKRRPRKATARPGGPAGTAPLAPSGSGASAESAPGVGGGTAAGAAVGSPHGAGSATNADAAGGPVGYVRGPRGGAGAGVPLPTDPIAGVADQGRGGSPSGRVVPVPQRGAAASSGAGEVSVLAKPPVRKLARDLGVDLASVQGTGPNGVVTRQDVEAAARGGAAGEAAEAVEAVEAAGAAGPAPVWDASREQRVPIRGVRKHMAAAMVASAFTAPHVTEFVAVDVTPTMELRRRVAGRPEFAGIRVSPLLFVAKALLLAVRRHPVINSSWDEQAQEIVIKQYVNLGIAAATGRGLIVPNIKDADRLPLRDLAVALTELTETARAGKTAPADLTGGTITITNVGVFGVDSGTPILNPGEAAILAFGAVRDRPWVVDGELAVRQVTQLGLSFDHRIIDGQLGSEFLADVAALLSDPAQALVWL